MIAARCQLSLLFIPLMLIGTLTAQDTSTTSLTVPPDSLPVQQAKTLSLYWYDLHADLKLQDDTTSHNIYHKGEHKNLIYFDFSDVFREYPLWFKYDLRENGRPAYVAGVNLFPQQTAYYYNGIYMNDPINGMYNLQHIPIPFIRNVESSLIGSAAGSLGMSHGPRVNIVPDSRESDTPWSRIVYKQGRFGYSMLDISLVESFSKTFAMQLGGSNNLYDGTLITANHDAQNFRGEFTWQYTSDMYIKGQFFLSRDKIGLAPYETEGTILNPFQKEKRNDYFLDMTWHPDAEHRTRLHAMVYYLLSDKEIRADAGVNYVINSNFRNYGADVNFAFSHQKWEIMLGTGVRFPVVFGNSYPETYRPTVGNIYAGFQLPLMTGTILRLEGMFHKHNLFAMQPGFYGKLEHSSGRHRLDLGIGLSSRYPNVVDMYFDFDSLFGNPDLTVEKVRNIHAGYSYNEVEWRFALEGGYFSIDNEIRWDGSQFENNQLRDFVYSGFSAGFGFWKIFLSGGGQYTFSDINVSAKSSAWGKLHFHDRWLKDALTVDGILMLHFYDSHRNLRYEPRLERFYFVAGNNSPYSLLNWKVIATIQEAEIFFEMDNSLASVFEVVDRYQEFYIRWRFGVNWIFWD